MELPEDIRHEILAFKDAYRSPTEPIETRHLNLYTNYCVELKPEHAPLITERMIKETTLTGTPDEIPVTTYKMGSRVPVSLCVDNEYRFANLCRQRIISR